MAKTFYTYREITRQSTEQLIRTYNRVLNEDAYANWFNPFEHRYDMVNALMTEMTAIEAAELWKMQGSHVEELPQNVTIEFTAFGIVILWTAAKRSAMVGKGSTISKGVKSLIRSLRQDGHTYKQIVSITGVCKSNVFRVLEGEWADHATRWTVPAN